jgi:hypothetical protein
MLHSHPIACKYPTKEMNQVFFFFFFFFFAKRKCKWDRQNFARAQVRSQESEEGHTDLLNPKTFLARTCLDTWIAS